MAPTGGAGNGKGLRADDGGRMLLRSELPAATAGRGRLAPNNFLDEDRESGNATVIEQ
jgi:hypothetical protein